MRTAIFVYEPTTVSIETNEDKLCLEQMGDGTVTARTTPLARSNKLTIERGIYKVKSSMDVTVRGDLTQITIQHIANNKDPFPDPPLNAQGLAARSSGDPVTAIRQFFVVPDERKLDHF